MTLVYKILVTILLEPLAYVEIKIRQLALPHHHHQVQLGTVATLSCTLHATTGKCQSQLTGGSCYKRRRLITAPHTY